MKSPVTNQVGATLSFFVEWGKKQRRRFFSAVIHDGQEKSAALSVYNLSVLPRLLLFVAHYVVLIGKLYACRVLTVITLIIRVHGFAALITVIVAEMTIADQRGDPGLLHKTLN